LDLNAALTFVKNLKKADAEKFMTHCGQDPFVCHGTLGPNDLHYVPAGYIVAEHVPASATIGFRLSVIVSGDAEAVKCLEPIRDDILQKGGDAAVLNHAIEATKEHAATKALDVVLEAAPSEAPPSQSPTGSEAVPASQ